MIEGAFYVWSYEELQRVLGDDLELFSYVYGLKVEGNVPTEHDGQNELKGKVSGPLFCIRNSS